MDKVTLIELTTPNTQAIGVRLLGAVARAKGYERTLVFMCGDHARVRVGEVVRYAPRTIDQIVELARGSRLVGISFLTTFYDRAVQVTEAVRERLGAPVIWGGFHATARPEEALAHADMVCIGEGENSFGELLESLARGGEPRSDLAGIWFRGASGIVKNPLRPLEQDLDRFPFQDYDLAGQHCFDVRTGSIGPLTAGRLREVSFGLYNLMMARGCPMSCAYCYNSTWKEMYGGQRYLRSRSVENTLEEIVRVRERLPFLDFVLFADDNFFAKSTPVLREFADKYPRRVGLPYWAQITPSAVVPERVELLVESGLSVISMGIQTASSRVSEIYGRPANVSANAVAAAHVFNRAYRKHRKRGMKPPQYDFILDSFWETEEDTYENVELLVQFPKPFELHLASLVPYPGTRIYDRARREGLIRDEVAEVYRRPFMDLVPGRGANYSVLKRTFANLLVLYVEYLPSPLIRFLARRPVRRFLSRAVPAPLLDFLFRQRWLFQKYRNLKRRLGLD